MLNGGLVCSCVCACRVALGYPGCSTDLTCQAISSLVFFSSSILSLRNCCGHSGQWPLLHRSTVSMLDAHGTCSYNSAFWTFRWISSLKMMQRRTISMMCCGCTTSKCVWPSPGDPRQHLFRAPGSLCVCYLHARSFSVCAHGRF